MYHKGQSKDQSKRKGQEKRVMKPSVVISKQLANLHRVLLTVVPSSLGSKETLSLYHSLVRFWRGALENVVETIQMNGISAAMES